MTVLIVDDTDSAREVTERILRLHGLQAVGARSGDEALSIIEGLDPDLMLLDVSMPGMDGLSLLARLRGDPRWQKLPVVMMTAICDDQSVSWARELGACEYLVKADFTAPRMLEVVRQHARQNPAN